MKPTVTRGATNNYQAPENWDEAKYGPCLDLQVRRDVFGGNEVGLIECFSTWKPDADELTLLNAGGVIEIGLTVVDQPAMRVNVVDPVEPALLPYVAPLTTINEDGHGV
jgi:hypothetical protein